MNFEGIKLEIQEHVALLTLNRPEKLNCFTTKMGDTEFPVLFREIQDNDDIRVLVITGAGRGFCAGIDVGDLSAGNTAKPETTRHQKLQTIGAFVQDLYKLEKPVIAAINGVAAGAGVSIALVSDIRYASENAKFTMAFVKRGLIPDSGATFVMPRLIGAGKAFELMYTGDTIDAREAERIGLVNRVLLQDKLMEETMTLAGKLAKSPSLALAQIKRAIHSGILNDLEQQLYFETYAINFCVGTEDFREGVNSFLEKRAPRFMGR